MAKILKKSKQPKVPDVVQGIRDVENLQENLVVLNYGKAGAGKTEFASTFPKKVLFIDINNEKGLKTVKGKKGIQFARVRSWQDFLDLYWWLKEGQDFSTIVLDQITGLQDLCMRNVRAHFKMDEDEPFQGYKKYGKLSGDMKQWLGAYRELSDLYHVVFLAHLREFGGGDEGEDDELDPTVSARVMPSVGSYVEGACDIIIQSFIRTITEKSKNKVLGKKGKERRTEYCARIGPHPIYTTKIRRPSSAGKLPDFIVNPTYQKLVAIEAGEDVSNNVVKKEKISGKK